MSEQEVSCRLEDVIWDAVQSSEGSGLRIMSSQAGVLAVDEELVLPRHGASNCCLICFLNPFQQPDALTSQSGDIVSCDVGDCLVVHRRIAMSEHVVEAHHHACVRDLVKEVRRDPAEDRYRLSNNDELAFD